MKEATLIYPHQLFASSPALELGRDIFLIEEPLLLTHNPIHRQKLMLHKLSMDAYQKKLALAGYNVQRIKIEDYPTTEAIFEYLKSSSIERIHVVDTTDNYLESAITKSSLKRIWYESPLFILSKTDAVNRFIASKRQLARFYKQLRLDKNILLEPDGSPTGGQWNFDEDNRKKIPKGEAVPPDVVLEENPEIKEAAQWAKEVNAETYGEPGCWLPYTHVGAESYLKEFLTERFSQFGNYEDAILEGHTRLWHSTLSPLLNMGLLTPLQVLDEAILYAREHDVPLNSLEGFVRQILGWREFIRASYESDGSSMRQKNFWNHNHPLPKSFWDGTTDVLPLNSVITRALKFGYTHHIERLMVMGNFMLLTQTQPDDVYRWFMAMYLDAYDWVMVPNVYGMSQFADGGSFATKPYISGSNYLKKMSNYPSGEWEEIWTALYWNFIETHQDFFIKNHRLSMMPRLLSKMNPEKRASYSELAKKYLQVE